MSPKSLTMLALALSPFAAASANFTLTAHSLSDNRNLGLITTCSTSSDIQIPCISSTIASYFQLLSPATSDPNPYGPDYVYPGNLTNFVAGNPVVLQPLGFVDNSTLGNAEAGIFPAPHGERAIITFGSDDNEMARLVPYGDSFRITSRWAICPFTFSGSSSTALTWIIGQDEPAVPTNTDCREVKVVRTIADV